MITRSRTALVLFLPGIVQFSWAAFAAWRARFTLVTAPNRPFKSPANGWASAIEPLLWSGAAAFVAAMIVWFADMAIRSWRGTWDDPHVDDEHE